MFETCAELSPRSPHALMPNLISVASAVAPKSRHVFQIRGPCGAVFRRAIPPVVTASSGSVQHHSLLN
jgi:hypothetical protein